MSEDQGVQIGREQDAQVRKEMGVYGDRELQQHVTDIGLKLAQVSERPSLPWHFTIVDATAINACALHGGYIDITRGILPFLDNEAQLVGVLGHEIGHVTARHAVVRGASFLPAGLRFAIDFPHGWDVTNGQTQVVAKEPGGNVLMLLQQVQRPAGRTVEAVALRSMEGADLRPMAGGSTPINGLDAFVGTYQGTLQGMGRVTVRAAHIVNSRAVFLMAGIAPEQVYPRQEATFTDALNSFRSMTAGEAEAIRPNRIALYTARRGDTWPSIAEREGKGAVKASTLAIMNGHEVSDQPRAGERLKIVVADSARGVTRSRSAPVLSGVEGRA